MGAPRRWSVDEYTGSLVIDGEIMPDLIPFGCSREEGRANARLIAAAPDMLAALQRVNSAFMSSGRIAAADVEVVLAAISKAEGR